MKKIEKLEEIYANMKRIWEKYPIVGAAFVFLFVFFSCVAMYWGNPGISTMDDHFFLVKYAYLLRTQGWEVARDFHWVKFSQYSAAHVPYDVNLFQLALIPFTYFKDLVLGLKASDIFWASTTMGMIYYIFRRSSMRFPFVYTMIIITSADMLFRITTGRAFVLTIALVFAEIYLAANKKYKKLFFVALFHALWHHNSFFLPVAIAGIVEVSRYLRTQKIYLRSAISGFLAVIVSFIFFPGFPRNVWVYASSLTSIISSVNRAGSSVIKGEGRELYPRNPMEMFFKNPEVFLMFVVVGICMVIFYYVLSKNREQEKEQGTDENYDVLMYSVFIFFILCMMAMLQITGRMVDYYFPGAVFLFAIVLTKLMKEGRIRIDPAIARYVGTGLVIFFLFSVSNSFIDNRQGIYYKDYRPTGNVAQWIGSKSEKNDLVFLQNWSYFPMMFFFNDKNVYSMGMEPKLLMDQSPALFWKWYNMSIHGIYCERVADCQEENQAFKDKTEKMSEAEKKEAIKKEGGRILKSIKDDFGARWVVSNKDSAFDEAIEDCSDSIADSTEYKSDQNGITIKGYKLK